MSLDGNHKVWNDLDYFVKTYTVMPYLKHTTKDVMREALWFADKSRKGTRFIFDDYYVYDIEVIGKALTYWNFKALDQGENKIMLQRLK